ncbi:MAG: CBS domain-containing protein [Lachnospiraceae bacterium]|nr:CBS domain-containing protein [Lachnospiraceae bacterium]
MNILFFLTPKTDVAYLYDDYTIAQALETIWTSNYTALPMINREGKYIGTVTEGDFLWGLLDQHDINADNIHVKKVGELTRKVLHKPVSVSAKMEDLLTTAKDQNFVPVVDDNKVFIGIVTRKDILQYCYDAMEGKTQIQQRA